MTRSAPHSIRVGVRTRSIDESRLRYLKQLGVDDVYLDHSSVDEERDFVETAEDVDSVVIDGDVIPTVEQLQTAREQVEAAGLRLAGIHSLPYSTYGPIKFGQPEAEERTELIATLIRRIGEAEIPILGYQWNPRGVVPMRTTTTAQVRGAAQATGFDLEEVSVDAAVMEREYDEAEMWEYYEQFIEAVVPVAEDAGVRMALHPIDPPGIADYGGIPRLFRNVAAFERAMEIRPSDAHGLKLCLGCFSQIGEDIPELIRRFGERDQIVFVHFRDVEGTVPQFRETFVDCGNYSGYRAMEALAETGFTGSVLPDHVPEVEGDTEWSHRARGFTIGYLRGLIDAVEETVPRPV